MKKILFLMLIIANSVTAQNADSLFVSANNLYKNGAFEKAIEKYKEIEAQNLVSTELYLNLGNAYYKLNKVGPTIFYYEKALQLNPLNEDVKNNLIFAKRLTLDRIEELPKSFLQKFQERYLQKLSYDTWGIIAIVFSIVTSILFLLFYFSETPSKKRLYFITSILSLFLLLTTLIIAYKQYDFSKKNRFAIIYTEIIEVKNAPTFNSDDIFSLHEGTKVMVLDEVDSWKKIKLADGKIGWLEETNLKEI